jgi:hypothetical protein
MRQCLFYAKCFFQRIKCGTGEKYQQSGRDALKNIFCDISVKFMALHQTPSDHFSGCQSDSNE